MSIDIKEKTKNLEANIIGCFWHNPSLFFDYNDLNKDNFKNNIWKFYFAVGRKMALKNIKKLDEVATQMFLDSNEKLLKVYEDYGGYDNIEDLEIYATIENVDTYINELKKWNIISDLISKFSFEEDNIKKLNDLNVDEVYRYYSANLNNVFINVNDDVETSKLNEDIDEIIEEADKGSNKGMPLVNAPMLSNEIGGWINGQTYIMGGLSGAGKTTITQEVLLSSVWELKEPCVVMLNEQDHRKWKQQFITWIINNKLLTEEKKKFNAKRWRQGGFTKEEFELLKQAKKLLNEKESSDKIIFVHFKSYSQKRAERIIRKYASLGVKKFALDTFKLSSDRDDEAFWLSMQEDMRKFDDLVKASNLNVALWCTLQLQKGSRLLRYLTSDNIGMAKNTIDVASVALLMRRLWNDEYEGEPNEITVRMPIEGTESFSTIRLDPKKKYVIIFIEKNRNGESQTYQIVAEQDLGGLRFKEVGICDIPVS